VKILRILDAVRFRGRCATCRHFVSVIGPAAYRSQGDGYCQNGAAELHLSDVYRRTTCEQHEAVTP
jgi:hypothetical protein